MVLLCNKVDVLSESEPVREERSRAEFNNTEEEFKEAGSLNREEDYIAAKKSSTSIIREEWQTWPYLSEFARRNGFIDMYLTSAKTGERIFDAFGSLI